MERTQEAIGLAYLVPLFKNLPLRIGFDAKRYFNNATGLGFYSRTLLDGLRHFYPEHDYLLYTPYNRGPWATESDQIRLPESWIDRQLHPLWRSKGVVKQLICDKVEVFHGLSHELPLGLSKAGIRSVVTMHDLIFMRFPDLYPVTDRLFYEKKYRHTAETADAVVAISGQTRSDLVEFFKLPAEKIRVIGQSCDAVFEQLSLRHNPDRFAFEIPSLPDLPASDYLISVGSLTPRKNWHTLLEALALLKNQGLSLPLVAVGTGQSKYASALRSQAKDAGLEICWLDQHVSTTVLAQLYRRAAALVYPSVFEGFGIPILEALTIGIPVVTSAGSCFEEVGGNAALYASPSDPEDLAEKILQSMDSGIRKKLLAEIPAQIAAFAPERICREWMEVYQDLIK